MRQFTILLLVVTMSGCSGGSGGGGSLGMLNPFNWFGGGNKQVDASGQPLAPAGGYVTAAEHRPLIGEVTSLSVEKTREGAIVRATGLPATQGYYDAELVEIPSAASGEMAFEFRIKPPLTSRRLPQPRIGTSFSREVSVATYLSRDQAAATRRVRVVAARNNRTARN